MAERWQQWMPFHIDRWRGSAHVQAMRAAARAGYLYLLASAWQSEDCSLPAEDEELQVLAGVTEEEWREYGAKILRRFVKREDGRYVNEVLLGEWTAAKAVYDEGQIKRLELSRTRSAAGRRGNERRWAQVHGKPAAGSSQTDEMESQGHRTFAFCDDSDPANDRLTETQTGTKEEKTVTSSTAAVPASLPSPVSPAFLSLPLLGGKRHIVTEADIAAYQQGYPAVDVRAELRKVLPWLDANPDKRSKTLQGSKQRIVRWLGRAQDRVQNRVQDRAHDRGGRNAGDRQSQLRGNQRIEQALEELARAGVCIPAQRAEAGAGEVWAAARRGDGCDEAGVVLQGYR